MSRFLCLLITIGILHSMDARASILEVPSEYTEIQAAVDASAPGDTLLLAPDIYSEPIHLADHGLVIASHYLLSDDTSFVQSTVLTPVAPETRIILVTPDIPGRVTLIGLTLRGASLTNQEGAAIGVDGVDLTVDHCILENNSARLGGGIGAYASSVIITHTKFLNNNCLLQGGGVILSESIALIDQCIFEFNTSDYIAAGLMILGTSATVSECSFLDNWSALHSAGLYLGGLDGVQSYTIRNNVFERNVSNHGTSLLASHSDTLIIHGNRFATNIARDGQMQYPMAAGMLIGTGCADDDIYDNEFYYNISFANAAAVVIQSNVHFHHNLLFRNCADINYAFASVYGGGQASTLEYVYNNLFFENGRYGESSDYNYGAVVAGQQTTLSLYQNDFYGNDPYAAGQNPLSHGTLNLANNYWGHPTGPYHLTQNRDGLGDTVMTELDVLPFATEPFTTRWLHAPEPFGLIDPQEGDVLPEGEITFRWHAAADSTPTDTIHYILDLAADPEFTLDLQSHPAGEDTTFTLPVLDTDQLHYWRVRARDIYDLETMSSELRSFLITAVEEADAALNLPASRQLATVYPNPFNEAVTVTLSLPGSGDKVELAIYDLHGRRLTSLHSGTIAAGRHRFTWQPDVATGVYLLHARGRGWQQTCKLVHLK